MQRVPLASEINAALIGRETSASKGRWTSNVRLKDIRGPATILFYVKSVANWRSDENKVSWPLEPWVKTTVKLWGILR